MDETRTQSSRINGEIQQAFLLVQRLERLSADSAWAHLASGYRGALLRCIDDLQNASEPSIIVERARLQRLVLKGFELLEKAAVELTDINPLIEPDTQP